MARRKQGALSAKAISKFINKPRRYGDGNGLYLQVSAPGTGSWLFRYEFNGTERFMGLGAVHTFTLAEARERARKARQLLADGVDPIEAKKEARAAKALQAATTKTFAECASAYYETKSIEWTNTKSHSRFKQSLRDYVLPIIGSAPVSDIDRHMVLRVLEQPKDDSTLWLARTETANRVRIRIREILSWAVSRGYRPEGPNPADWDGGLKPALTSPKKIRKVEHHPAMSFEDLPAFMERLRSRDSVSARALEFCILCAARTGEVTGAVWSEIDFEKRLWSIPAERMKSDRDHKVPLSDRSVEILKTLPREEDNPFIFIGGKKGSGLSDMAMLQLLRGMDVGDPVVHGFRSSFKDWCAEQTNFPNIVSEMALAHAIQAGTEKAYRRGDLLQKRRKLMDAWSKFCISPAPAGDVVSLASRRVR